MVLLFCFTRFGWTRSRVQKSPGGAFLAAGQHKLCPSAPGGTQADNRLCGESNRGSQMQKTTNRWSFCISPLWVRISDTWYRRIAAVNWFGAERCRWQKKRGGKRAITGSIATPMGARRPCFAPCCRWFESNRGSQNKEPSIGWFFYFALPDLVGLEAASKKPRWGFF